MNTDNNKIEQIINILAQKKQTISFAESCTGGRLASAFTAVSGVSSVLNGSVVSYSNEIKHTWLNVDNEILEKYGAVSRQCVSQMLTGIKDISSADYNLAISGIAGPSGGTKLKPVGTVYIGLLTPFSEEVFQCFFHGDRESIQRQSTLFAIEKLKEVLEI